MNIVKKQVQKLTILLLLWVSLPIFLLIANPETLPLPLLVLPFILLATVLYKTAETSLSFGFKQLSSKRIKLMASIVAVLPTLMLILSSIRQLTIRDSAIIIGLMVLLVFYMRRVDFIKA